MKTYGENFVFGSDADGDTYHRAAGVLARLAKGAANLKSFMNAAGTAPEWASGIFIGSFAIDTATASGTQTVTGVGFKPSGLLFSAIVDDSTQMSFGMDFVTVQNCLYNNSARAATEWAGIATRSIYLVQGSGIIYDGEVATFNSDGFTVNWIKTGAKTGSVTVYFFAIR